VRVGFARIELGDDRVPYEIAILNFRSLLERRGMTEAIVANLKTHLAKKKGYHAAVGHVGACGHYRCAVIHQEQGGRPRPGDVVHEEGCPDENEFVQKLPNRHHDNTKPARSAIADSSRGFRGDQAANSAQPNALI
jgi:hypothetical protein